MSNTVLFIHGAWLTPAAWGPFRSRFEAHGFHTIAPAWPFEDLPIDELRRSPPAQLRSLTIQQIVDHYDAIIRGLPEPPLIVGHSFGGLFTQMLLDRGLGVAGVALDPVPMRGVLPTPRALQSALPMFMHWKSWNRVFMMSFEHFATDFAQTLPASDKRENYERYIVPTPGRLYWQAALGIGNQVNVKNPKRAPLLLVAGEADVTVEPSMVRAAFEKQQQAGAETEFRSFKGRSHFLFAEPGWEEIADAAIHWLARFRATQPLQKREPTRAQMQ